MHFISARATRTAVMVVALSAGGLWALRAMDAKAEPPASDDSSPCAEGRALFAAKLAYLEARIAPEPSQQDAWRQFAGTMRASAGELDRSCTEDAPQRCSVDAGSRLHGMEKHAAAMQAMLGAMASAYEALAPNLTTAQRDILSRNIVASPAVSPFSAAWAPARARGPFMGGRCYVAASPLLGSTGFAGEYWSLMADQLIDAAAFDRVILAPVAVGASNIAQWAKGGALNRSMIPLVQDLVTPYRVTGVLWHQGESDFTLKTDPTRYKEQLRSFADTLRDNAIDAPVFVSTATRCLPGWSASNAIQSAQKELVSDESGFKAGVDTDTLLAAQDRYDDCHMADSGEVKTATAWAALLSQRP